MGVLKRPGTWGENMAGEKEAKEFYDKVIAGDVPAPEDVDNVFNVIDMLMKEVETADTFLGELEDALDACERRGEDLPDPAQFCRSHEKARQVF